MAETPAMTQTEALMWLNDCVGNSVVATLNVDRGEWSASLLEVRGVLRHAEPGLTPEHGDELAGVYSVGDLGSLDLTDVPDDAFGLREVELPKGRQGSELRVNLGENVEIVLTRS